MYRFVLIAFLSIFLTACSHQSVSIQLAEEFEQEASMYPVGGRYGLQINQKLHLGPYRTSDLSRSGAGTTFLGFFTPIDERHQTTSFKLKKEQSTVAYVSLATNVKRLDASQSFSWIRDFYYSDDLYAGKMSINATEWTFVLDNPHRLALKQSGGVIFSESDRIIIRQAKLERDIPEFIKRNIPHSSGFEFLYNDRVIGAVDTSSSGFVWIFNDLDESMKHVIAAASLAILVRHDITE
ncbi:hypothetical protein [Pleionea sediminis]|uniref:hypothetical protein n=1 Tax=Pleionea sediminis TaxID=2569479 RepID=UPI0011849ABE|nr:hypothetical protein [Pleionea sediminis]